ncbi:MAG TPA: hypothetical protein VEB40_16410 [Flavipsychrobacter sp.]|nr:hypothetical protein [Flavipsychrobacter sp.]
MRKCYFTFEQKHSSLNAIRKYSPFLLAVAILCVGVWLAYPYYQYYIDPDATAYLTISRRYAAGNYDKAINGYWSPWSTWLTALLIKTGKDTFPAAIIANTCGAAAFIYSSNALAVRLSVQRSMQWVLAVTISLFLCYAVYMQTFSDLWMCAFLLLGLRLMLAERFTQRPVLWILLGLTGTLGYFAKQYGFHFFMLNTVVCTFFVTAGNRNLWLKISAISISVMIVGSLPWIWLLHEKYGILMTGTAGNLNLSWYLLGHPLWKDGIDVLLPPVYPDSPYYWEDPWWVNGATPHFYSSPSLFVLQLVRLVYNAIKLVQSMNAISAFYAVIWLLGLCVTFSKKLKAQFNRSQFVVLLSFLLFPLSFLLINFEPRYIWYTLPLSMILSAWGIQYIQAYLNKPLKSLVVIIFAASYLVVPVKDMQERFLEGKDAYITAKNLERQGIKGIFATNVNSGKDIHFIVRLAYHSGNAYYNMPYQAEHSELLKELRRYNIRYFYYLGSNKAGTYVFPDEQGNSFPVVYRYNNLLVFDLHPSAKVHR